MAMTAALKALNSSAWFLFAMGLFHIAGHLKGRSDMANPADAKTRQLVEIMRGYVIPDFPIERSMLAVYEGLSLVMSVLSILVSALVLIAAAELKDGPKSLRRLARMYTAGLLVFTVISVNYFVWPPTIFLLVSFGLAAFALARLRKLA
jgi:hypothetical protein